jgi:hypothetical protein
MGGKDAHGNHKIPQPKICLVFRGKGGQYYDEERTKYDPRVHVMFQHKAWFDDALCLEYANIILPNELNGKHSKPFPKLLFMDNLSGQVTPAFRKSAKKLSNADCHYLPSGCTDEVQVVDAGVGRAIKLRAMHTHDQRLVNDKEFFARWVAGFSASEKRIYVTELVAEAWEYVCQMMDFHRLGQLAKDWLFDDC